MFFVTLAGNLGKDPETRFTPSGQKVTTFSLAINQRKGKEEVTTWVRITVWGDRFDKMISFLKKGSSIIVSGRMNPPTSYTDKEGRTQISLEVTAEMLEFSPFGRSDRSAEGQTQGGHFGSNENTQSSQYSEGQFQTNSAPQYGKSQTPYGSPASGQGQYTQTEEDALPF